MLRPKYLGYEAAGASAPNAANAATVTTDGIASRLHHDDCYRSHASSPGERGRLGLSLPAVLYLQLTAVLLLLCCSSPSENLSRAKLLSCFVQPCTRLFPPPGPRWKVLPLSTRVFLLIHK